MSICKRTTQKTYVEENIDAMERLCGWKEDVDDIDPTPGELLRWSGDFSDLSGVPESEPRGEKEREPRSGEDIAFFFLFSPVK